MSDRFLKRRIGIAPLAIAVFVYGIVTIGNEYGMQVLVTPTLALGFGASPLAAWLLARSERRIPSNDRAKRAGENSSGRLASSSADSC